MKKRQKFTEIIIRRQREHEIIRAIEDLEARGFILKSGPTQEFRNGKIYTAGSSPNRRKFQENTNSSVWFARLGKVAQ